MCGRFYIDPDDMSDEELIALLNREKANAELREESLRITCGEVQPGDCAAVIAMNRNLRRRAFVMKWGYRIERRLVINARSETAASKPLFQQSAHERRCLIPASAYFEWDHRQKPFAKYRFHIPKKRMIYLAGLYRFEPDNPLPAFTILTREAAPDIAQFHDRMPVIVPNDMTNAWLDRTQSYHALLEYASTQVVWQTAQ